MYIIIIIIIIYSNMWFIHTLGWFPEFWLDKWNMQISKTP